MASSETLWLFGYGSNMDATNLEQKKNVKVLGKSTYISMILENILKFCEIVGTKNSLFQIIHLQF